MNQVTDTLESSRRPALTRRTLLLGTAWSVPAVLVVGATPAHASSNLPLEGGPLSALRGTGNQAQLVTFTWTVTNPNSGPVTVNGVTQSGWKGVNNAPSQIVRGDASASYVFILDEGNASEGYPAFTFTVIDARGTGFNVTFTVTAGSVGSTSPTSFSLAGSTYTPIAAAAAVQDASTEQTTPAEPGSPAEEPTNDGSARTPQPASPQGEGPVDPGLAPEPTADVVQSSPAPPGSEVSAEAPTDIAGQPGVPRD